MSIETKMSGVSASNTISKRKISFPAIASPLLALLVSQHYLIHMLMTLALFGSAGMSFMSTYPLVRRGMLFVSLVMIGITIYQFLRWKQSTIIRLLGATSILLSLGLITWSVIQFGF